MIWMNIRQLIKVAFNLDQTNEFLKADYITENLIKISQAKDSTKPFLKSIDTVMSDPDLFKSPSGLESAQDDISFSKPKKLSGSPKKFLEKFAPAAKSASVQTGGLVPPSIILAMAAQESGWGKSKLAQEEGNYFGIKQSPTSGSSSGVKMKTFEFDGGKHEEMAEFAKFDTDAVSAMAALPRFFSKNKRYSDVIKKSNLYNQSKNIGDLFKVVDAIFDAGYSTDPDEPLDIKRIISDYNLNSYD